MVDRQEPRAVTIVFQSLDGEPGLEVIDPIERRRRTLRTATPVTPEPADPESFPFPVETCVRVETPALSIPTAEQVLVRDGEGQMVAEVEHGASRSFPPATYTIEPSGFVKVYARVESALEIQPDGHGTEIAFGRAATVEVGSRSTHERPAATVTATEDPEDVLAAISTFGSALKTTSPERAFGSFRGHPPDLEVGSERSIPEGLEPPAADLRVEVPADLRYAYPVAPLAYYLGAPVEPGPEPRIVGGGLEHDLGAPGGFEAAVERTLKHVFMLDCLTRTEGLYRVDLHERDVLESHLDLDFAALYDAPQPERLAAYLEVPHEPVAEKLPDWRNAAHVDATAASAPALPYLVDDLAIVRIADPEPVSPAIVEAAGEEGLLRGGAGAATEQSAPGGEPATRSSADPAPAGPQTPRGDGGETTFVNPVERVDAIEETWLGEGTPLEATKAVPEAYENRIGRSPSTGSIDIAVVCNAAAMDEEGDVVDDVYGSRENLPFDVGIHRDLTTDELADLLAEERDFLHYVGHIDDDGFECADGRLDVADLETVGVDAFFLNACQSYEQGMALIEGGAIGGIVTVQKVVNHGAVRIGRAVARLLNCGFPLRPALEVARDESVMGSLYIVVGDGGLAIAQPESGTPLLLDLDKRGGRFTARFELFGAETGIGGVCFPFVEDNDQYYLASGSTESFDIDREQMEKLLDLEHSPIRYKGQLRWSYDFEIDDF